MSLDAPVAQPDRATGFEPVGRGFESLRARQILAGLFLTCSSSAARRRAARPLIRFGRSLSRDRRWSCNVSDGRVRLGHRHLHHNGHYEKWQRRIA